MKKNNLMLFDIEVPKRNRSKIEIPKDTILYRPASGTEVFWFENTFCAECKHFKYNKKFDSYECKFGIMDKSMAFEIDDKQYPKYLRCDSDGKNIRCLRQEKKDEKR